MREIIISIILILSSLASIAQHADCDKAMELREGESKYLKLSGAGSVQEIDDTSSVNLYWFKQELHSCWLMLPVNTAGELTIDIHDDFGGTQIDFLLFRYNDVPFCSDVKTKKIMPVRTNLGIYALRSIPEKTGLSLGAEKEFVSSKEADTYSKSLTVKKGEVYYLVINSTSKSGGNVTVGYKVNQGKDEFGKSPENLQKKDFSSTVPFSIKVVDDATGQPVVAKIAIDDLVPLETVKTESSEFSAELNSSQSIRIDCNAPGYMFVSQGVMAPMLDPSDASTYQPVNIEIRLKKLKEGDKVALRNIRFQPDKAEFVPGSYPALQSLTNFLQTNPNVKVEIGGHINGPDGSSAAGKAMSKKRAKAVYDYLIKRGIEKGRLKYKGYGNSQMIWPDPQNERQAEENRRVEIKVLSD